ncbi:MAG: alpha-L-fucosidase [Armatimonadetes bacterium]|nr:alpha-L-fucosidase [Armatimonadota bacterium]
MDGTSSDMWGGTGSSGTEKGAWLADSRFAMFIHWGLYSELGARWQGQTHYGISEWIMNRARIGVAEYERIAEQFNPVDFDAGEWVDLAAAAGMRHMMITSKHHDGFAMFASKVHPYNIATATPFGRDPMAELSAACAERGLRFGFYYSQTLDWHEPDGVGNDWDWPGRERDFQSYLRGKAIPQIEELLTGYGPICGIWFDCPGPITEDESREIVAMVRQHQPDCLVNSRIGNNLGDYDSLGDQEIPRLPRAGLWETPDTHNDTWAYAWYDLNFKSAGEIARRLVRVVSRGGTYLLNVGPDGRGRIPEASAAILREVGVWVHAHEQAIHGAQPSTLPPLAWGECTARGNTLFLHVFDWPTDGRLVVPGLAGRVWSARLDDGTALAYTALGSAAVIDVPRARPDGLIPVVTVQIEGGEIASGAQVVLSGCTNHLEPGLATLTGCAEQKVSWMEKFGDWHHAECVGGWTSASSCAWTFDTVEPGRWYLDIRYSCPADDDYSEWQVTLDGEMVSFPLLDTGEREHRKIGWGALPRFREYRVGVVTVPEAGSHTLAFGPTGEAGAGIRVEALRLSPVS